MTRDEFWTLIDSCGGDGRRAEDVRKELFDKLVALGVDGIVEYVRHFGALLSSVYTWDIWAVCYHLEGGCGDDQFTDFRCSLVLKGRQVFELALQDPESLADVDIECDEESGYVASRAYRELTGEWFDSDAFGLELCEPDEPTGERWDFDDEAEFAKRLPKVHAKM